jgi:hypothetical protein
MAPSPQRGLSAEQCDIAMLLADSVRAQRQLGTRSPCLAASKFRDQPKVTRCANPEWAQPPCGFDNSCSMIWSTLKLDGRCRGGKLRNVAMN